MHTTRRAFLASTTSVAALALLGCRRDGADTDTDTSDAAPDRSPEPEPWSAPGSEDAAAFAWGVQSGDAGPDRVRLSVRTTEPAVRLVVVVADGSEGWLDERTIDDLVASDGVVQLSIDGLSADTAYSYVFTSADGARRSPVGRFRTALAADGLRNVRFAATSCLGGSNPGWASLSVAAAERFDFVALLGDTVYADGAVTLDEYRAVWGDALAQPAMRDLTASTSLVATWDDHEVVDNSSYYERPAEQHAAARQAFLEALPQSAGPDDPLWRKLSWGATADVFVLDCRSERDGERYIGDAQMAWLKEGLRTSAARFKIVLNSVPITDMSAMMGDVSDEDRWQGYPAQREEILAHIVDNAIPGVLWLAGDFHFAMVSRIDPEGGVAADLHEVLCGPAGSRLNEVAPLFDENSTQYDDVLAAWNTTWFDLDPAAGTVRIRFVGDDGAVLAERTLTL